MDLRREELPPISVNGIWYDIDRVQRPSCWYTREKTSRVYEPMNLGSSGGTKDKVVSKSIQSSGSFHIVNIMASLSRNGGGVSPAVRELAAHQSEC